jgi:hypothetical protein
MESFKFMQILSSYFVLIYKLVSLDTDFRRVYKFDGLLEFLKRKFK